MGTEVKNLPLAEARRQLVAQLAPRSTRGLGEVRAQDLARARAELQGLEETHKRPGGEN